MYINLNLNITDVVGSKLKGTSKVVPALSDIKTPLRDGDKDRAGDPAYAGSYFINCNSDTAPDIVDAQCNPVMSRSDCYSGCVGRASIITEIACYYVPSE